MLTRSCRYLDIDAKIIYVYDYFFILYIEVPLN